jgi:hypothetical protein
MTALDSVFSADVVAAIQHLVDERIAERLSEVQTNIGRPNSAWLYGDQAAADYLGWPVGRVQKMSGPQARKLPVHKIGQRKAYRKDELDRVLAEHSQGPQISGFGTSMLGGTTRAARHGSHRPRPDKGD